MAATTLTRASNQWATRPNDERYLSLADLHTAVSTRREHSVELVQSLKDLPVRSIDGQNEVGVLDQQGALSFFTHYSFGQACQRVQAPTAWLRRQPAQLAAINLSWAYHQSQQSAKVLTQEANGTPGLVRAFTSETYGRIWDAEVVEAVMDVNADGRWQIPAASYAHKDPVRATTLYASDHDVFMFLVDPAHPIEITGETDPLFRGFMVWNSETGDRSMGVSTFLYRYVCDNRIIWGARDITELVVRHSKGGPDRFAERVRPALKAYSEGSTRALEAAVVEAKVTKVADDPQGVTDWLVKQGFGKEVAEVSVDLAAREEGDPTNLWNVVQGVTAFARSIDQTDSRVALERQAGALLPALV
jgi:hypothetical protein